MVNAGSRDAGCIHGSVLVLLDVIVCVIYGVMWFEFSIGLLSFFFV